MKLDQLPEPERWSERSGGTSVEDAIGASLQRIRANTEATDAAALRGARRAMATPARDRGGRIWAVAIAVAILSGGGAVAAGIAWHVTKSIAPAPAGEPSPAVLTPGRGRLVRPEAGPESAPALLPDAEPAPDPTTTQATPTPAVAPRGVRGPLAAADRRQHTEPPRAAAPEPDDEARLLARAFRQLRNEGDASAALAALDERDRKFGAGTLASEAALARAEALLLLGRTADALPILLGLRNTGAGLVPEVRAVRAELLAGAGRCPEASADFDALVAPGAPSTTRERALYGRAACALRSDSAPRAVPDLERYLAEYPHGRFVAAVREALEKLRRP